MFIIFGHKLVETVVASGTFHCPQCEQKRPFAEIKVSRWFTLFFIPLFEVATLDNLVRCDACWQRFGMEAVSYDPEAARREYFARYRRLVALALVHAGREGQRSCAHLADLVAKATDDPPDTDAIDKDMRHAHRTKARVRAVFRRHTSDFKLEDRRTLLQWTTDALTAAGPLDQTAVDVIIEVANAIGLPIQNPEASSKQAS